MRKIILTMQAALDGVVSDVEKWMTLNDEIIEDSGCVMKVIIKNDNNN